MLLQTIAETQLRSAPALQW